MTFLSNRNESKAQKSRESVAGRCLRWVQDLDPKERSDKRPLRRQRLQRRERLIRIERGLTISHYYLVRQCYVREKLERRKVF